LGRTLLELSAIEDALREVQKEFARINATLATPRDPLSDQVLGNLMAGYEYVNTLLASGINPVARGNSRHLLNLNNLVLCGTEVVTYEECGRHIEETERRFYDDRNPGGVRALMGYLADHKGDNVWRRAAGAYTHILSEPQLFVEGNHRTGALIMSLVLTWEGKPPFVLTVENAKAYFDPSSLVKVCKKHSLRGLFEIPKLRRRFARLLKSGADPAFLRPVTTASPGARAVNGPFSPQARSARLARLSPDEGSAES
jgi:hypothetical protein